MNTVKCRICGIEKTGVNEELLEFFKYENKKTKNFEKACRPCLNDQHREYRRSERGVVQKIYYKQKNSSKQRGMDLPNYSIDDLVQWCHSQENWKTLYNEYKESDYEKEKVPSVDRIDDYVSYTLENIQLMTWRENNQKAHYDISHNINSKKCVKVNQYKMNGDFIQTFDSIKLASIETTVIHSNIIKCCRLKVKSAGGFQWRYFENTTENIEPCVRKKKIDTVRRNFKGIIQYDLDGNILAEYNSKHKTCKTLGISMKPLNKSIKDEYYSFKGWKFKLVNENADDEIDRRVNQYSLDGSYMRTFKGVVDASEYCGVNNSSISMACSKTRKSICGFMWEYNRNVKKGKNIDSYESIYEPIPVHHYTIEGKYLNSFGSLSEASTKTNIITCNVNQSCNNHSLTEGVMFRFASEFEKGKDIEPFHKDNEYYNYKKTLAIK